ncbi:MAG TPA: hypothetical protein VFE17_11315 [Candidatus Baltobacteraceae bacterium]|jgi:hypothetical protein|nr:hypothetical protein [Candidatus Baltobacteraceae bacterium]
MHRRNLLAAAAAALALLGTVPRAPRTVIGTFALDVPSGPFLPGSRLTLSSSATSGPIAFDLLGPGDIENGAFIAPALASAQQSTIIASTPGAIALSEIRLVPAPAPHRPLLAVASYDSGIALHDPQTFALLGYVAIGGPPGDVAFSSAGDLLAPDTDGDTMIQVTRSPWHLLAHAQVPMGNEVVADPRTGATFVSNRDVAGKGALTQIAADGTVTRVITGETAEGLALDSARGAIYVGNVNDNTVAQINVRTMQIVRKIRSVERTFGMALDADRQRLYVVSNTSKTMHSGGGYVAAIDLRKSSAPIVAKSANMPFPLGAALDEQRRRIFVTDEAADEVAVLDATTLRARAAPLRTCRTPWRPRIVANRLYVPCARSNTVDVFDLRSLHRVKGAPFITGGFPLSVAVWP